MAQVYKLSRLLDNNVTKSKWYRWCWINYSLRCSFFWFFVIRSPPFFPLSTILVIRAHSLRSWRRLNVFISIARDLFYLSFLMSFMSELSFLLPSALPSSPLFPSLLLPSSSSLIPPLLAYFYACFPASAYFPSVACLLSCSHALTFIMLSFGSCDTVLSTFFSSIFSAHLTFTMCTGACVDHVSSPIQNSD